MKLVVKIFVSFFSIILWADTTSSPDIVDFWIRAVPKVSKMSAAFGTIKNSSEKPIKLIKVTSDISNTVEIHTTKNDDGIMKMRKLPSLSIPAKGESVLRPGGNHIMFINLKKEMIPKKRFRLNFEFDDGQKISKEVEVLQR